MVLIVGSKGFVRFEPALVKCQLYEQTNVEEINRQKKLFAWPCIHRIALVTM